MNINDKSAIEHYPGVILRFDSVSKTIHYLEGAKRSHIFPDLSLDDQLSLSELRSLIIDDDKIAVIEKTDRCIESQEEWNIEYRLETRSTFIWVRERSYFTVEGQNKTPVVGLFIDDITDVKNEKQQFLTEINEASKSASSKNEFFASISHEIRTPMNAVMGMAQILGKTTLDVEQKQYVNTIIVSSNALVQIINDILDLSKIEAGKIDILEEVVDLEYLCLEICHLLSTRATEKGLKLYLNYQVRDCQTVSLDKGRLRQILINLISNAIKFTDVGYVELHVENNQQDEDLKSGFSFSVKDTGIGISSIAKNKLFEAYTQADGSISQRFGGTGLGLKISQRLVSLMGGNIEVDSTESVGSNFCFTLPVQMLDDGPEISFSDKSCLLVGEDLHGNRLIKSILQLGGATVDMANSTVSAFKFLSTAKKYDIFIVDNVDEASSSLRIFTHIKAQQRHKKSITIMLNDIGIQENNFELFEAGVDVYLTKPISPGLIFKAISEAANRLPNVCKATYISNQDISLDDHIDNYNIQTNGKALIADDVEVNQIILKSMLMHIGLTTEIANNGEEAVAMIKDNQYDIVFMDCRMPVMDGFEATQKIREIGDSMSDLTIVALTANAGESDKKACLDAGMNDFLSKPYTEKELTEVVMKWMETESIERVVEQEVEQGLVENEILDHTQFNCIKSSLENEFSNFALGVTDKFIVYQQDIISALKNGDMDKVYEKAHALVGVAAMIGARQVSEIALSIEEAGKEMDLEKSISALAKLDDAISKTHSMIIICLNPEIEMSLQLF